MTQNFDNKQSNNSNFPGVPTPSFNQQSNQPAYYTTQAPQNAQVTVKHKKKSNFLKQISLFFSSLIILALIIGAGAVYVMLNPSSQAAEFASRYLNFNYKITDKDAEQIASQTQTPVSNTPTEGGGNRLLDAIFGLNKPASNQNVSQIVDPANMEQMTSEKVVETVLPSVVSISVTASRGSFQTANVAGTGFFVSEDGLIITNKHVISAACANPNSSNIQILGTDSQNKAWELRVVSLDPSSDLALLKVREAGENKFSRVSFYPTEKLKLGMPVIAIGNALGQLKNTVTAGIVSGLNRQVSETEDDSKCGGFISFDTGLIQTDAAINSGNSGGPLFSREGLLIGVNTFNSPSAQSIGLSIPAEDVVKALDSYLKNGKIVRPYLGVRTLTINDTLKRQNSWLPVNYGTIIALAGDSVVAGSAADKAGLKPGDIILKVNDNEIREADGVAAPLRKQLNQYEANQKVTLTILRPIMPELSIGAGDTEAIQYEPVPRTIEVTLGALESEIKF